MFRNIAQMAADIPGSNNDQAAAYAADEVVDRPEIAPGQAPGDECSAAAIHRQPAGEAAVHPGLAQQAGEVSALRQGNRPRVKQVDAPHAK